MSEGGVVVLGMGRSGTSAVTRTFVSAAFFAGRDEDLMEATDANPTGHWENLYIRRVNEMVLDRLGGTWFDPRQWTGSVRRGHGPPQSCSRSSSVSSRKRIAGAKRDPDARVRQ
jgi:hypothetical protein